MSAEPINAFTVDVEDWFHILELEGAPGLGDWSGLESRVDRNVGVLLDCSLRCFRLVCPSKRQTAPGPGRDARCS